MKAEEHNNIIWRIQLMYTYEKKMPVKNTTRKNPKRSDG